MQLTNFCSQYDHALPSFANVSRTQAFIFPCLHSDALTFLLGVINGLKRLHATELSLTCVAFHLQNNMFCSFLALVRDSTSICILQLVDIVHKKKYTKCQVQQLDGVVSDIVFQCSIYKYQPHTSISVYQHQNKTITFATQLISLCLQIKGQPQQLHLYDTIQIRFQSQPLHFVSYALSAVLKKPNVSSLFYYEFLSYVS